MKVYFKSFGWLLLVIAFCLGACSASPVISQRVVSTRLPASPAVGITDGILYRGDAGRRGISYEPAVRSLSGVKWQKSFDEDAYFPVFAGNALYIGTASGKLLALDPDSGEERWSFEAESGPILAVALSDGLIYFGAGEKSFYAVEAQTGLLNDVTVAGVAFLRQKRLHVLQVIDLYIGSRRQLRLSKADSGCENEKSGSLHNPSLHIVHPCESKKGRGVEISGGEFPSRSR